MKFSFRPLFIYFITLAFCFGCVVMEAPVDPSKSITRAPASTMHNTLINAGVSCYECHEKSKPTGIALHTVTGYDCKSCHNSSITNGYKNWTGGRFSHSPAPGACATCHDDSALQDSFPVSHISKQSLDCKSCHQTAINSSYTDWAGGYYLHSPTPNSCASCHDDSGLVDRFPVAHIATGADDCKACHTSSISGGFINWTGAAFDHTPTPTACAACHADGAIKDKFPAVHISVGTTECKGCHQATIDSGYTNNWAGGTYDHVTPAPTDCRTCHANGAPKDSYPPTVAYAFGHITKDRNCTTCHASTVGRGYDNWTGAAYHFSNCNGCHAYSPNP